MWNRSCLLQTLIINEAHAEPRKKTNSRPGLVTTVTKVPLKNMLVNSRPFCFILRWQPKQNGTSTHIVISSEVILRLFRGDKCTFSDEQRTVFLKYTGFGMSDGETRAQLCK